MERAGFIHFEPTEFEIVEEIVYEETLQRPENLRFFTFEDQMVDYFDKMIPKTGKLTKYEFNRLRDEIDRLHGVYDQMNSETKRMPKLDWVKSIYTDVRYKAYSFLENWAPIFSKETRYTPNYYPRMISALPIAYQSPNGKSIVGTLVDEDGRNPIKMVGDYTRTRGVIHEDGTFEVVPLPMLHTGDTINTRGFYIEQRKNTKIPVPIENNPFLRTTEPTKFITDEPLETVFPSLETLLNNAIPKTTNPYSLKKYLKLYDISLQEIPWELWRRSFQPETREQQLPRLEIEIKASETKEPSDSLRKVYTNWRASYDPFFWITLQEDAGTLVSKLVLSRAGENGVISVKVVDTLPPVQEIDSTPSECLLTDSFESFLESGVYRPRLDKCVPLSFLAVERAYTPSRLPWNEDTESRLLKEHAAYMRQHMVVSYKSLPTVYKKPKEVEESVLRTTIVSILADKLKDPIDKYNDLSIILIQSATKNNIYYDKNEAFLICKHTLAILRGDIIENALEFYTYWTSNLEGFRCCKYCGEQVDNQVFTTQDEFDENGFVIKSNDTLDTKTVGISSFTNSLLELKSIFILDNHGEATLYLLLSLLQILPIESQITPILGEIRALTQAVRANKKIEKYDKERIEGIFGIAATVVLLQTHNPFLIPRRSYGSNIIKLDGFPRDTNNSKYAPTLDFILFVLKTTFKDSPNTLKGQLIRSVIKNTKQVREESIKFITKFYTDFKAQFEIAKERYVPIDIQSDPQFAFPITPIENNYLKSDKTFTRLEQSYTCSQSGPTTFLSVKPTKNIEPEPSRMRINRPADILRSDYSMPELITFTRDQVSKLVKLGLPKETTTIKRFLKERGDWNDLRLFYNCILRALEGDTAKYREIDTRLNTMMDTSFLRDIYLGLIYQILNDADTKTHRKIQELVERDLTLSMLLINREIATREDFKLKTREREVFKQRMRDLNDTQREITKHLLDIGIAPYIITNADREIFQQEYKYTDPESSYNQLVAETDIDRPEEGYNATRDEEDGLAPRVGNVELEYDYGDYGDRREQPYDRDYAPDTFDDGNGYGV